jgi:hypothetical protein
MHTYVQFSLSLFVQKQKILFFIFHFYIFHAIQLDTVETVNPLIEVCRLFNIGYNSYKKEMILSLALYSV